MLARNAGPSQSSQYIGTDHKDRSSRPRFVELTNRFRVTVRLFSNRSQMTSKCAENKEVVHEPQASLSLQMFLPHFDIFCDLLLNRPTATWNLFVFYNNQKRKKTDTHTCLVPLNYSRICTSLGTYFSPKRYFSSLLLFSLSHLHTVSSKSFFKSFAKTFCKTASLL